jgi:hypothetical protein
MALNSMWATAWMNAARPSTLPKPRRGRSRGCTSSGRGGRPGMRIGFGRRRIGVDDRFAARERRGMANVQRDLVRRRGGIEAGAGGVEEAGHAVIASGIRWASQVAPRYSLGCEARDPACIHHREITTPFASSSPRPSATAACARSNRLDPGDVLAVEAGTVEACDRGISVRPPPLRGRRVLVDQPVAAQQLLDVLLAAAVRDQLLARRHVDAVDVRIAHRRRRGRQVHLARTGIARHLHDLLAGGAAHDRIVDQQHHAVAEFQRDRVELARTDFTRSPCPGMMKVRPT